MPPPVVALLERLREEGVDRTENPVIAEYTGPRVDEELLFEEAYEKAMARALVDHAERVGLRISVESSSGSVFSGEDSERTSPSEPTQPHRKGLLGAIRAAAKGRQAGSVSQEPIATDFRLKLSLGFDEKSEGPDLQKDTWSYKGLKHTISLAA